MKFWSLAVGAVGLSAAWLGSGRSDDQVIVVSGDTKGYMSPCGCTSPMSGGIRRRISVARGEHTLFIDNGNLISSTGRQDRMKAETLVQAMIDSDVAAIHLTPSDAALGRGIVLSLAAMAEGRLISTHLTDEELGVRRWVARGSYLVGAVTTRPAALAQSLGIEAISLPESLRAFIAQAEATDKKPILLLNGPLDEARRIAGEYPCLEMIVYSASGDPPDRPEMVGSTLLVTPGDKGRSVVRLRRQDGQLGAYEPVNLGPQHPDDALTAEMYQIYLRRVDRSNLLEEVPRVATDPFAGTAKCGSCHAGALDSWKNSAHSHALETLEKEGHPRDPDCVACHVVGLESTFGFRSRAETPDLTDVGCESCHGPGAAHANEPLIKKMPKLTSDACISCHNPENSPKFDFQTYWEKIKH